MLVLTHTDKAYTMMINHFMSVCKKQYSKFPEELWEEFETELELEFKDRSWSYLINELVQVYSNYYTLSDLEEIIKIYESPIGKKMAEHSNSISMDSAVIFKKLSAKFYEEFDYKIRHEYGYE